VTDLNPQREQMAAESMVRTLEAALRPGTRLLH
jgi:hypothetical protein